MVWYSLRKRFGEPAVAAMGLEPSGSGLVAHFLYVPKLMPHREQVLKHDPTGEHLRVLLPLEALDLDKNWLAFNVLLERASPAEPGEGGA